MLSWNCEEIFCWYLLWEHVWAPGDNSHKSVGSSMTGSPRGFNPQVCSHWACVLCVCELVAQSCLTLYHPMDCSPLSGSSVHGILQARILELVAFPFSRGSSWPRDWTLVSCIAGRFFTTWATREAHRAASNLLLIVTGQVFLHQHWFPRWLLLITFCPRKS